ncbi:TatD DNase family protein [Cytobacillus firmus]|uniref:TatD DNase family protein n=2 Tax=Cytobacillus TaxID=2675230 RepID=A0A366JTA1_CYTFI|nr:MULTISPECIES: TatD family hydrolase [Cytobacillus]RBP92112.1 TatD DNase family protein [Cytobacillus firmus]TDX42203.1 TatD DNase family protein [Cytobacillus oceanisediminis]
MDKYIDAHIHLDKYSNEELKKMFHELPFQLSLVTVSCDLESCKRNLALAEIYPFVKPAFGFHPEQGLPSDNDISDLFSWINAHKDQMAAVGEVGLPYYLRSEEDIKLDGYIELLEEFIKLAKRWDKPIVLHAVYEDTPVVCDLLEKHSIKKAHFHWFKGDISAVSRLISNDYSISFTPDIVYEKEIQNLIRDYPLDKMMAETDGPWAFEGPFKNKPTHPAMMAHSISTLAEIKEISFNSALNQVYENTKSFYNID